MKTVAVFLAVVTVAVAVTDDLLQRTDIRDSAGQISASYAAKDGTHVEERGVLKPLADGSDHVLIKSGSYHFYTPDGVFHKTDYTADEFGYKPVSGDIPRQVLPSSPTF